MSVESLCTGDRVRRVVMSSGTFGNVPEMSEGKPMECRIDVMSGGENRKTGVANETRSGFAFFAFDPKLKTGHYLRWLGRAEKLFDHPVLLRVTTVDDAEGRPGEDPWMWTCSVTEDKQSGNFIREEQRHGSE